MGKTTNKRQQQARLNHTMRVLLILVINAITCAKCFSQSDSITVTIKPSYDSVSRLHRFLLGENYRKLWATPVKVKVLSLSKEKGGLTVVKQGGGL